MQFIASNTAVLSKIGLKISRVGASSIPHTPGLQVHPGMILPLFSVVVVVASTCQPPYLAVVVEEAHLRFLAEKGLTQKFLHVD